MKKINPNTIFKSLLRILLLICITVFLFYTVLYFVQDKIVFMEQNISMDRVSYLRTIENVEEIFLEVSNGTKLHGWVVNNNDNSNKNLLIYFGGNGEEVSHVVNWVSTYTDYSIVLFNYRGYGLSEGKPGEKILCSDALEIYDHFINRTDSNSENVVVMGRSIGTGVATYLANERDVDAVILVSPYDSLVSVAEKRFFFIPAECLLKHKFKSIDRAPSITVPLTILFVVDDEIISPLHSKRLASKWGGEVEIIEFSGVGHDSILNKEEYWNVIRKTLEKYRR